MFPTFSTIGQNAAVRVLVPSCSRQSKLIVQLPCVILKHFVVQWVVPSVWKDCSAFVFKGKEPKMSSMDWPPLKTKSTRPFEMSGAAHLMVRRHFTGDSNPHPISCYEKQFLFRVWATFINCIITKLCQSIEWKFTVHKFSHCRVTEDLDPRNSLVQGHVQQDQ